MLRRPNHALLLALLAVAGMGTLISGCDKRPAGSGLGPGPAGQQLPEPPLPDPHPAVALLDEAPFEIAAYALSGTYPTNWTYQDAIPDANAVVQLRQGADTYFSLGFLPGMRRMVLDAVPELPTDMAEDTILEHAAQGVVMSENFFVGARKTVLMYSRVLFGEHQVLTVTQLIRRPTGGLELLSDDELERMRLMQGHYLDLAPEGSRRISRHYVWILGDDVWIAQVIAPPATFLERATEIEERLLPSLRFGPSVSASPPQEP